MLARLGLSVFFTMNVIAFTMALWTTDVYGPDDTPGHAGGDASPGCSATWSCSSRCRCWLLLGWPLFEHAWAGLRRGVVSTDWLLATGVGAAFATSFLSVFRGEGPIYFEVGCVILVMTTLGRWLEATGRLKAGAVLDDLARLLPDRVRRIVDGREEIRPAGGARGRAIGSACWPGERFPADGRVARHRGLVDEQVLTGESRPVLKEPGDRILGRHAQPRRRPDDPGDRGGGRGNARPAWSSWSLGRGSRRGGISGWRTGRAGVFVPAVSAIALDRLRRPTGRSARWSAGSGRAWRSD